MRSHQEKPLLDPVPPQGQEARVEAVFDAVKQHIGFVPDALRLYSFSPPLLENFVGNISYFNSGERLAPSLMAMIRYIISNAAQCSFCIDLNEGFLTNMGLDLDTVRKARANPDLAPLPEREKTLLKIAVNAIDHPDRVGAAEIQAAKGQGWSERDIFDVVVQAANNRALNHVLRALKVEAQGAFAA
jgi:alkylhydroperoxidase family enzyme